MYYSMIFIRCYYKISLFVIDHDKIRRFDLSSEFPNTDFMLNKRIHCGLDLRIFISSFTSRLCSIASSIINFYSNWFSQIWAWIHFSLSLSWHSSDVTRHHNFNSSAKIQRLILIQFKTWQIFFFITYKMYS